jgi:hypothetical protein
VRVKVLGRYWFVRFVTRLRKRTDADINPNTKTIRLRYSERGAVLMESILHELIHAAGWHIDESFVEEFARDAVHIMRRPEIWDRIKED